MTCEVCEIEMVATKATRERPYIYDLSGLKNVALIGITVYRCKECHTEAPAIPRIGALHRFLTEKILASPGRLTGDEIRFLRKSVGMSGKDFAERMRVSPTHLSKVENGAEKFSESVDQLARAVVSAADEKLRAEVSKLLLAPKHEAIQRARVRRLKFNKDRWAAIA